MSITEHKIDWAGCEISLLFLKILRKIVKILQFTLTLCYNKEECISIRKITLYFK